MLTFLFRALTSSALTFADTTFKGFDTAGIAPKTWFYMVVLKCLYILA